MAKTRLAAVALALAISLAAAPSAFACSTDDKNYFDGFTDTNCVASLNHLQTDVFGGLRLQTNGSPTTTSWDTEADFTGSDLVGVPTLEPSGTGPSATLVLGATPLALLRDLDGNKVPAPVLKPEPSPDPDNDNVTDPAVVRDGPTSYVMYYAATADDSSGPAIFRATSSDGRNWTKRDADLGTPKLDPVLQGSDGEFDAHGVYGPDVIYDASDSGAPYKMWYSGRGDVFTRVGYATSTDGVNWTKAPDFVLDHGRPGARDSFAAAHPSVMKDGATWKMWYEGDDSTQKSIAYATSPDGLTWSKGGAVIVPAAGGNTEFGTFAPTVWKLDDGSFHMLLGVRALSGGELRTKLAIADSDDGVDWNVGNIALNPQNGAPDSSNLNSPEVFVDSTATETYKLYYAGNSIDAATGGSHDRILYSFSNDGQAGWQGNKQGLVLDISSISSTEPFDSRQTSGPAVVATPGGATERFVGVYGGIRGKDFLPRLGEAKWDGTTTWSKVAGTQTDKSLLALGNNAAFDHNGQRDPSLLYSQNANGGVNDYHLYFTGISSGGATAIGYAAAQEDGITLLPSTWSKTNTAMFSGDGSGFDSASVSDPYVVRDPNGTDAGKYVLYYVGSNGTTSEIGRANPSTDQTSFTHSASASGVVAHGAAGAFDANGVSDPVVFPDAAVNDKWYMLYTGTENIDGRRVERVGYRISTDDGATWSSQGSVVLDPSNQPFAFDEVGVHPQSAVVDSTDSKLRVWYDGVDRTGRTRGGHASVSTAAMAGQLDSGAATYQLGDTTTPIQDWRTIEATATANGAELWMSYLQPYSSTGSEFWSGYFPVSAINSPATLDFLLTVTAVRFQVRLAGPADNPSVDTVDLAHAPVSFFPSGDATTTAITPPAAQTITKWRTLTVASELFQPGGTGSGGGTVKVLDSATSAELASQALTVNGDTTIDLSGISPKDHPALKVRFDLTSSGQASPLVRSLKVEYFTNVSAPADVTLSASPNPVDSGQPVTLSGNVSKAGSPVTGVSVAVQQRPSGGGAFTVVGNATTDSAGNYSLVANPTATTDYQASYADSTSGIVTVTVKPPPATLTLAAAPAEVIFGQQATLSGNLSVNGAPQPSQAVNLLQQPAGTTAFSAFGSATTDASGNWTSVVTPQVNTTYQATAANVATPPSAAVNVHQALKLKATRKLSTGTFSGTIAPAHPGKQVVIQLRKGTSFVTFAKATTTATSTFSVKKKLKPCGKFQFRAVTAADADHLDGTSPVALVEKHRLTMKVSANKRTVTFTGKVSPLHKSGTVVISRVVGKKLSKLAKAKLTKKSTFKVAKKLKKGKYVFVAGLAADKCHFAGTSAKKKLTVR